MTNVAQFDPGMFGTWPAVPVYGAAADGEDDRLALLSRRVWLETKSREAPGEDEAASQ